jgi:hypothetical protein
MGVEALDPIARAPHAAVRPGPGPIHRDEGVPFGRVARVGLAQRLDLHRLLRVAHAAM